MPNVIKEGGLRLKTAAVDQSNEVCYHAAADSATLGVGDAVKTYTGGAFQSAGGPYAKSVTRCASGDAIYGVVMGIVPLSVSSSGFNLDRRHCPASTLMQVLVRPANPYDVYAITEDGTLAVADVGYCADITGNGGGTTVTACNTTTGMSTIMLDTSTAAASTGQLKIIGFENTADNTPASANSSVLVRINETEIVGAGSNGV